MVRDLHAPMNCEVVGENFPSFIMESIALVLPLFDSDGSCRNSANLASSLASDATCNSEAFGRLRTKFRPVPGFARGRAMGPLPTTVPSPPRSVRWPSTRRRTTRSHNGRAGQTISAAPPPAWGPGKIYENNAIATSIVIHAIF